MTHDIIYENCPDLFCNKFQLNRDQNNYNLRSNNLNPQNLVQPISRTKNNFFVNAPALWNEIPSELQELDQRESFKHKLKDYLLNSYGERVRCINPRCNDHDYHL